MELFWQVRGLGQPVSKLSEIEQVVKAETFNRVRRDGCKSIGRVVLSGPTLVDLDPQLPHHVDQHSSWPHIV